MRDFCQFYTYCNNALNDDRRKRFRDSAYIDAYNRITNYDHNFQNGHFQQLFYATYDFLTSNNQLISEITPPPFEISENRTVFNTWSDFLIDTVNSNEEYDVSLLREKLPDSCGGTLCGGGGWSPTLKIMFSVVAKYIKDSN